MSKAASQTTLPVLKSVPTFFTSDRQNFTDKKSATIHELGLQIRSLLIEQGMTDHGEVKQISLEIAKKFDKFKPVFNKLQRAQQMKG